MPLRDLYLVVGQLGSQGGQHDLDATAPHLARMQIPIFFEGYFRIPDSIHEVREPQAVCGRIVRQLLDSLGFELCVVNDNVGQVDSAETREVSRR